MARPILNILLIQAKGGFKRATPWMLIALLLFGLSAANAQAPFNIRVSHAGVDAVLRGEYDPAAYAASDVQAEFDPIICGLEAGISPDTLQALVQRLQDFETRNTYADTSSAVRGIGAARRWAFDWFSSVSARNENRLLVAYMDFEMPPAAECGAGFFRNVFAVLPGRDTADASVVLVEGHMDSRCEVLCDTACYAPGADDNGSGTALVMELARVMSAYTFDHTLVFLLTVGEEQGLFGAEAFAQYCSDEGIGVKAVQNNDITGGVICGPSSSPPSCSGDGAIDSLSVRIFSSGVINSIHKDYARFMKTIYREKVRGVSSSPMAVRLMSQEDRSGRGGDHIPFRVAGFRAIRVCASHEHGDANTASAAYTGRQHSVRDVIGVDTDGDFVVDSFFVDFRYLQRNAVFNGAAMAAAALGPDAPALAVLDDGLVVRVTLAPLLPGERYRIGVRQFGNDFEALYEVAAPVFDLPGIEPGNTYRVSAALVNAAGVQSLFSAETNFFASANTVGLSADTALLEPLDCLALGFDWLDGTDGGVGGGASVSDRWEGIWLYAPQPNPVAGVALFSARSERQDLRGPAFWKLHNAAGVEVWRMSFALSPGDVRTTFSEPLPPGRYTLSLWFGSEKMRSVGLVRG
ncbi:MAG: M20/M25/M40 family metallo-hydrolase [Bacteroidetes bacterium]|nr:M20/M25/M40 family metallo-hydrolase [Bacteroidota bacterium]